MTDGVAERYERFALDEAPGRSEVYTEWATGVATDAGVQAVLERLMPQHRQPPLVFAVSRLLGAPVAGYRSWRQFVIDHADDLVTECARRGVQINEPLRLAALLPALSLVEGPIALLELGAAAGLCLYPDRYSFRIDGDDGILRRRIDPDDGPSTVLLTSAVTGELPELRVPEVIWRAGVDLDPIDVRVPADRAWLESLIWPGEHERAERIAAAITVASADPPLLRAGDAIEQLEGMAAAAPDGATLVVTTPGMLVYLPRPRRAELIDRIRALNARWITIDPPALHDAWRPRIDPSAFRGFAVAVDGRVVADADPLGRWWEWRAGIGPDAA